MTVRAHARRDLALIFRAASSETENHHHEAMEAEAPGATVHPRQVIAGDVSGHCPAWPALSPPGIPGPGSLADQVILHSSSRGSAIGPWWP